MVTRRRYRVGLALLLTLSPVVHSQEIMGVVSSSIQTGYVSAYQTVYDSLTTPPHDTVASAQNTMISSIVSPGTWAKLDVFVFYAQSTNGGGEALINWINPGTGDASLVGGVTFTANEGITPNGSTTYSNTNYNPSSDAVQYTLNSCSIGCYIRNDIQSGGTVFGARDATARTVLYPYHTSGDQTFEYINNTSVKNTAVSDSQGMYIITRTASDVHTTYKNGSGSSGGQVSNAIPNAVFFVGGTNNSGLSDEGTWQVACWFAGGGLTESDANVITNAVETYLDYMGKGVIP